MMAAAQNGNAGVPSIAVSGRYPVALYYARRLPQAMIDTTLFRKFSRRYPPKATYIRSFATIRSLADGDRALQMD